MSPFNSGRNKKRKTERKKESKKKKRYPRNYLFHATEKMAAVMTTQKTKRRWRHVLIFEVMLLKHFADRLSMMLALCREWIAAYPSHGEP